MKKENTVIIAGVEYVPKSTQLPTIDKETAPYQVGAKYFIRTVTYYYTGRLVWVGDKELVLDTCAWIADTGRFANTLKTGDFLEVEPMGDGVVVGRGSIIDACKVDFELPTKQK